jgi:hypothetical protein
MRLPLIRGIIRRRMLVNFRVDASVMAAFLPSPFRPKTHRGHAIAGVCLIRLEQIRPAGFPAMLGIASENAAHRVAVIWTDQSGEEHEGVFIPRRDTGSLLNHLAGGRVFPGEHHFAEFDVTDDGKRIDFAMRSRDGQVRVKLCGRESDGWPAGSCFSSLAESSRFFETGSLGYSVTSDAARFDGLRLVTDQWKVGALDVDGIDSSFFANQELFPEGSIEFDHALIMRDIPHEWRGADDLRSSFKKDAFKAQEAIACEKCANGL